MNFVTLSDSHKNHKILWQKSQTACPAVIHTLWGLACIISKDFFGMEAGQGYEILKPNQHKFSSCNGFDANLKCEDWLCLQCDKTKMCFMIFIILVRKLIAIITHLFCKICMLLEPVIYSEQKEMCFNKAIRSHL